MTASTRGLGGGGVGVLFLLALWGTDEKPHNKVIKKKHTHEAEPCTGEIRC